MVQSTKSQEIIKFVRAPCTPAPEVMDIGGRRAPTHMTRQGLDSSKVIQGHLVQSPESLNPVGPLQVFFNFFESINGFPDDLVFGPL